MALVYSTNNTPATASGAMWLLRALLVSAGWTVPKDSDGSNYSNTGAQITGAGTGANGIDNNYAWYVIVMPGCSRSFMFQRSTNSYTWTVRYSPAAGFVGGSPNATTPPTATDSVLCFNAANLFGNTVNEDMRWSACAQNAAPYGFMAFGFQKTTLYPLHALGLDPISDPCAADADPYVVHCCGNLATSAYGSANSAWHASCFNYNYSSPYRQLHGMAYYYNAGVQALVCGGAYTPTLYGATPTLYYGAPNNTYDGLAHYLQANVDQKDDAYPVFVVASQEGVYNSAHMYRKGHLTLCRWVMQPSRSTGSRGSIGGTNDSIVVGHLWLPWDGSAVTV